MTRATAVCRGASVAVTALLVAGCMTWTPGWRAPGRPPAAGPADAGAALERADALFAEATDAPRLARAIEAYEAALKVMPADDASRPTRAVRHPLTKLAEAHILYGAAYARGKAEKSRAYISGIRYAEQAMAEVPAFRQRVEAGNSVGDAAAELGPSEMAPMLFWVTGVSYYFKECLSGPSHLWNFRWMLRTREVMQRMMAVDPTGERGAVPFSLAIYYIGLPRSAGGSLERASELLAQAEAIAPDSLLVRWGRAKYLHVRTGDREAFRRDLEWVLAQDPQRAASPWRWNVFFQRDAGELLASIDRLF